MFYAIFFLFLLFNICTTKKSLYNIATRYIQSVNINKEYYSSFIEYGFSEESCNQIFMSDALRTTTAKVMSDRIYSLFNYDTEFGYGKEECEDIICTEIKEVALRNNIDISDNVLSLLTTYTCDVSGITNMLIYDSPAAYRDSVLSAEKEQYDNYNDTLVLLSKLSHPAIPVFFGMGYILFVFIMFLVATKSAKQNLYYLVCDTIMYPSLVAVAFSLAQLFRDSTNMVLIKYVYSIGLVMGVVGVLIGIAAYLFLYNILKSNKKVQNEE